MSTYNTEEQNRVNREQDYVKEKGHEAVNTAKDAARKVKEGDVSMPSTEQVTSKLDQGERALEGLKQSERGRQLDSNGEKVVDDVKRVLADHKVVLGEKNDGDLLQRMIRHIWALMQELRKNPEMKESFEEWQSNVTSIMNSGDFVQFFQQAGDLFTSLKDTEEFLALASELINLTKVLVSENTEKATDNDPATVEAHKRNREIEQDRIITELRNALRTLSSNHMWNALVHKGKQIGGQAKEAGYTTKDSAHHAAHRIRDSPNFQELVGEFKLLLQRLVGDQMSVEPLFEYSKKALNNVLNNETFIAILREYQQCAVELAEDPKLLELQGFQGRLDTLSTKADEEVNKLRNDPDIVGAKEESRKVSAAIKNEPANVKLLNDMKTLYHDVISDRPGQIIDPEVLKNLRGMVVPLLIEHLRNIPLPDVHDSFSFLGKTDYTLTNMKISLPELVPESIHMRFEYEMDANPMNLETTNQHTYLYMQADNIQVNLKDVNFSYDRKSLPKLHDSGVFDVHTLDHGLTVWMKMSLKSDSKDKSGQYLEVLKTNIRLDRFVINFNESKHDKIYEMLTHMFSGRIRRGVVDGAKVKLQEFGKYFNEQIVALIEQAKTRSADISQATKVRAEQARSGFERLKINAKETANDVVNRPDVTGKTDEAKSSAKGLVYQASDRVQEALDDKQQQLEQRKTEKQLDSALQQNAGWKNAAPAGTSPTGSKPVV